MECEGPSNSFDRLSNELDRSRWVFSFFHDFMIFHEFHIERILLVRNIHFPKSFYSCFGYDFKKNEFSLIFQVLWKKLCERLRFRSTGCRTKSTGARKSCFPVNFQHFSTKCFHRVRTLHFSNEFQAFHFPISGYLHEKSFFMENWAQGSFEIVRQAVERIEQELEMLQDFNEIFIFSWNFKKFTSDSWSERKSFISPSVFNDFLGMNSKNFWNFIRISRIFMIFKISMKIVRGGPSIWGGRRRLKSSGGGRLLNFSTFLLFFQLFGNKWCPRARNIHLSNRFQWLSHVLFLEF